MKTRIAATLVAAAALTVPVRPAEAGFDFSTCVQLNLTGLEVSEAGDKVLIVVSGTVAKSIKKCMNVTFGGRVTVQQNGQWPPIGDSQDFGRVQAISVAAEGDIAAGGEACALLEGKAYSGRNTLPVLRKLCFPVYPDVSTLLEDSDD